MQTKKKLKKSKVSVKRLLLKTIWFSICSIIVLILGVSLFLAMLALNGNQEELAKNDLVAATILDTLVLCGVLIGFWFLFKKRRHTLLRWTRKSFIILTPLVVVACILTTISLLNLEDNAIGTQQSQGGVAGSQNYFEGLSFQAQKLLEGTNQERTANSLSALTLNEKLNAAAVAKCEDMVAKNYWSHNDPAGNEPWHFMTATGYSYTFAGENLAYGYTDESAVVSGWMASEGHRKNILDSNFAEVGFGMCKSENFVNTGRHLIVVQFFAKPEPVATPTSQSNIQRQSQPTSTQPTKTVDCELLYQTYYQSPMIGAGTKPTSTHIIHYIGTDDYDYQVSLYNSQVATYNSKWQSHKSNYLTRAQQEKCSTNLKMYMIDLDEARPYPV
jgi:uncharacterized protein YkwD